MLENWLQSVDKNLFNKDLYSNRMLGHHFSTIEDMIQVEQSPTIKVTIIGDNQENLNAIRTHLYKMSYHFEHVQFIDLGCVRKTDPNFLIGLFNELLETSYKVVVLSQNQDVLLSYLKAKEKHITSFQLAAIDQKSNQDFVENLHGISYFYDIGLQGHLSTLRTIQNHQIIRLWEIKTNVMFCEGPCRNVDVAMVNLSALKHHEIIGHPNAGPAGMTSEEMTQIFRYFGFNENLTAIFIQEFDQNQDPYNQAGKLIAQLIYYYGKALEHCYEESFQNPSDFQEYVVQNTNMDDSMIFIRGNYSHRWWIKLPDATLIACSELDYKTACKNDIPTILLQNL